jgi:hypothetical protein
MSIEIDQMDFASYRFYMIPDYSPTEGRIIHICNHCNLDGISVWSMYAAIDKDYDFKNLPRVSPPPWYVSALAELFSPITMLKVVYDRISFD